MSQITFGNQEPFARGSHRACYFHPENPKLCIKVMTEHWRKSARRMRAHWTVQLLRRKRYFHENLSEYHFCQKLGKRLGNTAWQYVPQVYELIQTDCGEGMITDLITDHNGSISITLAEYIWRHGLTENCQNAIEDFWKGLQKNRIFVQGRPDNVVVHQKADGTCQLYAIDGFGFPQLIPVAKWIPSLRAKRFRKLMRKQEKSIQIVLKNRDSGEKFDPKAV